MIKNTNLATILLLFILSACKPKTEQKTKVKENTSKETNITNNEVDLSKQNEAIKILLGSDEALKKEQIAAIINLPNEYNPAVLYTLSHALFQQNEKDEACYWFYIGQLRARIDANLTTDETAKQAVQVLNNQYGNEINQYAFRDKLKLEQTVNKVVAFVKENKENYDRRWIYLHGMEAVQAGLSKTSLTAEMTKPSNEWEAIKTKTIDDYYQGFITYVKESK